MHAWPEANGFNVGLPCKPFVFQPSKGGLWINEPSVTICHFKSAPMALDIRERRQ
jgi:integrase